MKAKLIPLKSRHFIVKWEIDIYTDNSKNSAIEALKIMQDPESPSKYFTVKDVKYNMQEIVDLGEECEL